MASERYYRRFPRLVFALRKLANANYEREMELLPVLCDRSKTGLDIGAKVGMYTYRIRKRSADVIAFEPIPLFNQLLRAVFEGRRGRIEPVAVSDRRGTATMRLPYDHEGRREFGRSTISPTNELAYCKIARTEPLEVETRRIDDYSLSNVGFIKVDVEGHELAVLEGAAATIDRERPNLLVECNDEHHAGGVAKLATWMRDHDYEPVFMDGHTVHPIADHCRTAHARIENFICVHRSRTDVRRALEARIRSRRFGGYLLSKI